METGTGKTYVYLRTLFELNEKYGFTKFVIVVPSVAIKEGVYKTLQTTEDHFRGIYANTPFEYFLYDSAKLGQVRNFAGHPKGKRGRAYPAASPRLLQTRSRLEPHQLAPVLLLPV